MVDAESEESRAEQHVLLLLIHVELAELTDLGRSGDGHIVVEGLRSLLNFHMHNVSSWFQTDELSCALMVAQTILDVIVVVFVLFRLYVLVLGVDLGALEIQAGFDHASFGSMLVAFFGQEVLDSRITNFIALLGSRFLWELHHKSCLSSRADNDFQLM